MTISCDCSVDVDEPARCYVERIRRARKVHRCCECGDDIEVGERYEEASGVGHDGDPFRYHTCLPCSRIRAHYCPSGWIWGDLRETIHDCLGFDYVGGPGEGDAPEPWFDGDVKLAPVRREVAP